jgi:hypothetical protein
MDRRLWGVFTFSTNREVKGKGKGKGKGKNDTWLVREAFFNDNDNDVESR